MTGKHEKLYLLGEEKIEKALLKLGIPTMIGMLISALYNVVDAFFVGKLGTLQMAAVSIIFPVAMIGTGIGLLFGSGAGSYLARLLGKKEYDKVAVCTTTVLGTGIATIAVLICGMLIFFNPFMRLLGATDSIMPYAKEYGIIFIISLIFNVFNVMVNNMIISEGSSTFSMMAMLIGGISNIILDPICIFTLRMGVEGAAVATLISSIISSALYVLYLCGGKSYLKISIKYFIANGELYREVCKVGIPLLVFQLLASLTISVTNISAKTYGNDVIAAMGIVNRIVSLEAMAVFGFLKGYQPLVGYNYGAGNTERTRKATKIALWWSTLFCILFGVIGIVFSKQLILAFNKDSSQVLQIGTTALIITLISYMTMGIQVVYGTYFLAIGRVKEAAKGYSSFHSFVYFPISLALWDLFQHNS